MERADKTLAFMLQYENIAWYENGAVRILDRRIYPLRTEFVTCRNHLEVTKAIKDMVTQSAGPYTAAAAGMALAAYECRDKSEAEQTAYLEKAAYTISHARPTTANRMGLITGGCLEAAKKAMSEWIKNAENCGIPQFHKCADTMRNWYAGIINSFSTTITNGFTEGCNNKIKVLKRNAYGYKNFKRFRNRILHIFSHQQLKTQQAAA